MSTDLLLLLTTCLFLSVCPIKFCMHLSSSHCVLHVTVSSHPQSFRLHQTRWRIKIIKWSFVFLCFRSFTTFRHGLQLCYYTSYEWNSVQVTPANKIRNSGSAPQEVAITRSTCFRRNHTSWCAHRNQEKTLPEMTALKVTAKIWLTSLPGHWA